MIAVTPIELRLPSRCSLFSPDRKLSPEQEAEYIRSGGHRIRAAHDQIVGLCFDLGDPTPLAATFSRSPFEHESRGGLYQSTYDAACAAIDLDDEGCRVQYDLAYNRRGPEHLLALAVPDWRHVDPAVRASASSVMRDDPGRSWFAVWRLTEQLEPRTMAEITQGLLTRIGEDQRARRVWHLPIAGTGRVDDVRWIFDAQTRWTNPDNLAELAGVDTPVPWTPAPFTPRGRRGGAR